MNFGLILTGENPQPWQVPSAQLYRSMLGQAENPFGGWLQGGLGALRRGTDLQLTVASPGSASASPRRFI